MTTNTQTLSFNSALCVANSWYQAKRILEGLRTIGSGDHEISVVGPDQQSAETARRTVGRLLGISALVIPGLGLLAVGGPITSALGVGAAACGLAGGIVALGFPQFVAQRYESQVTDGNILISIHVASFDDITKAESIIERSGGRDVTVMW